jgi:hypothetical protein
MKGISCFSNLASLALTCIGTTMDISVFSKVTILSLSDCRNLSGWSFLGKQCELFIEGCGRLGDVSHIANVVKLSLRCFAGNIPSLQNVIILDLSHSYNVWRNRL